MIIHQPKFEVALAEIDGTVNELHHAIVNLSSWMKPEYVSKNLVGYSSGASTGDLLCRDVFTYLSLVLDAGDQTG